MNEPNDPNATAPDAEAFNPEDYPMDLELADANDPASLEGPGGWGDIPREGDKP